MKPIRSDAVILRRIDYGEADRIITLLTDTNGKIRVMAKGVRKAKSKLAGGIELFSVSEIQFIKGRSEVGTLVSTRMSRHYGGIVKDLQRTELAYMMLKTVDKILEDNTGQEYFDVLVDSLAALDDPKLPPVLAEASFYMRVMQVLGAVPDFTTGSSGIRLDPESSYEFDQESVSFKEQAEGSFNKNHIKVLKLLSYNDPKALSQVTDLGAYLTELMPVIRSLAGINLPG